MQNNYEFDNVVIANLLRNVAAAYQIEDKNENKFKIIAYERAADAIEHLSSEVKDIYDEKRLEEIPGVGKSIAKHLSDIFSKGRSKEFDNILKGVPQSVYELLPLEGVGPKMAYSLVTKLNIKPPNSVQKLKTLALKGKVKDLPGFGEDSQAAILKAIKDYKGKSDRHLLNYAESVADLLINWMNEDISVVRSDTLGSLRRKDSTVGDIDIACATLNSKKTIKHFINYSNSKRTLEEGEAKASIIIPGNIQVDLRVQKPDSYGALLQHFTGSKHHNIKLREYSLKKNLSLSEYGITDLKTHKTKKLKTEKEFYNELGMSWIPPELREDNGEIEAAINDFNNLKPGLPKLIELHEIKSDLQIHSNFDIETSHDLGLSSYVEIVEKANYLGYEYIAFTDHNPSVSKHSRRKIEILLKRKKESIDVINYSLKSMNVRVKKVFNCLELDILSDGSLPVSDKDLQTLDFALVSIHSNFRMDKNIMTNRILSALSHPNVLIFAHPTGRKLNERESIEADWEKIFDFCIKNNKFIEINADPMRLDLPDHLVKEAVKMGVKLSMGTDAHHKDHMDNMKYAVSVARRGWAEKNDIVNTRSLEDFQKMLL